MLLVWFMSYWLFMLAPPAVPTVKEPRDDLA
jgi:hypothetical protein